MKVYIVSEGSINTGHECQIRCVCASRELANQIADSFNYLGLSVTEFDVIGSAVEKCEHVWANELLLSMPAKRKCVKCGFIDTLSYSHGMKVDRIDLLAGSTINPDFEIPM